MIKKTMSVLGLLVVSACGGQSVTPNGEVCEWVFVDYQDFWGHVDIIKEERFACVTEDGTDVTDEVPPEENPGHEEEPTDNEEDGCNNDNGKHNGQQNGNGQTNGNDKKNQCHGTQQE